MLNTPHYDYRVITPPPGAPPDHPIHGKSPTIEISVSSANGHDASAEILIREVPGGILEIRVLRVRRTNVLVGSEVPAETGLEP